MNGFREIRRELPTRKLQDREQAEQQSRKHRHRAGESEHRQIDHDLVQPRQIRRCQSHEDLQAAVGERHAGQPADQAQRQAFDHEPTCQSSRAGAERRADRELRSACFRPDEQQIRDVRTRDQQQDADAPEQHPQELAHVTDDVFLDGAHGRPELEGVRLSPAGRTHVSFKVDGQHAVDIGVGVGHRDARLQPRQSTAAEVRGRLGQIEAHGQNQIHGNLAQREARGHHADHFAGPPVDRDRGPNHTRITAEAALPVAVAQHRGLRRAGLIVVARKRSAQRGWNVQCPQGTCRHQQRSGLLGIPPPGDCSLAGPIHSQFLEGLAVRGVYLQHLRREREAVAAHVAEHGRVRHRHDVVRIRIRKRFDHDAVDHAENGRGRANAERERQDDRDAEGRMRAQHSDGVTELLSRAFDKRSCGHFVHLLSGVAEHGHAPVSRRRPHNRESEKRAR